MTWRELRNKIEYNMSDNELDNQVPIFVYCNGEMKLLNTVCLRGENLNIDNQCEDIKDFQNQYYLLCGLSEEDVL